MAEQQPSTASETGHVIIAGFGLPGRSLADSLRTRRVPYRIIEMNADVVARCMRGGTPIVAGDARDESVLLAAGITTASVFAVMIPDEAIVFRAVEQARRLSPSIKIVARCAFISGGFEATKRGANQVIVAEQAVARELTEVVQKLLAL